MSEYTLFNRESNKKEGPKKKGFKLLIDDWEEDEKEYNSTEFECDKIPLAKVRNVDINVKQISKVKSKNSLF